MFEGLRKGKSSKDTLEYYDMNGNRPPELPVEPRWIWVHGYKALNANMCGYGGFQYEFGKTYKIQEGTEVKMCSNGFHFCLSPRLISQFYKYGRLFKVRALVLESEFTKAQEWLKENPRGIRDYDFYSYAYRRTGYPCNYDKLVAKEIEILEEIPISEARGFFYSAEGVKTDEDYMDFIQYLAEHKDADGWYFQRYMDIIASAGISGTLSKIFYDSVKSTGRKFKIAEYAKGLGETKMSDDMKIYLLTKKVDELVAEEKK
jgi:hypothetical protein